MNTNTSTARFAGHAQGPWEYAPDAGFPDSWDRIHLHNGAVLQMIGSDDLTHNRKATMRLATAAPTLLRERDELHEFLRAYLNQADQYAIGDIPSGFHELAAHARKLLKI